MKAVIVGLSGTELTPEEEDMLLEHAPAGIIFFARNIIEPGQFRQLTNQLHAILPPGGVLLIDQEGGRVARLRPPHWLAHPPAAAIGALYGRDRPAGLRAAWLTGALIGLDCRGAGIDVACTPVLDLCHPGAHDIIGDRAFGAAPAAVTALGRAAIRGLRAAGVQPIIKHIPGHGRARTDSHLELPVVAEADLESDFAPFWDNADAGWAMTAHILYTAWDAQHPATLSATLIETVIRGAIGFPGVLVSDDLTMKALAGSPAETAVQALAAGCDLALHCSGIAAETEAVLRACPPVTAPAQARMAQAAAAVQAARQDLAPALLAQERDRLLA